MTRGTPIPGNLPILTLCCTGSTKTTILRDWMGFEFVIKGKQKQKLKPPAKNTVSFLSSPKETKNIKVARFS